MLMTHHDLDDQKSWTVIELRKDQNPLSMIYLKLLNNVLQKCLEQKSTTALWLKLESICMSNDLTNKMHVKMKLFTHEWHQDGSVLTHLLVFIDIVDDLISKGGKL
jgi:hypothetical protein